jgi:hypothetical protein
MPSHPIRPIFDHHHENIKFCTIITNSACSTYIFLLTWRCGTQQGRLVIWFILKYLMETWCHNHRQNLHISCSHTIFSDQGTLLQVGISCKHSVWHC